MPNYTVDMCKGQAPAGSGMPEERRELDMVTSLQSACPCAYWLTWDGSSILWLCSPYTLGGSPACEPCFLSTLTLPPPEDSNTYLLRCSCLHPAPQIPGLRQLEHFCIRLILFFPLPPDGPLASSSLFQHRLWLTIKLHYPICG